MVFLRVLILLNMKNIIYKLMVESGLIICFYEVVNELFVWFFY